MKKYIADIRDRYSAILKNIDSYQTSTFSFEEKNMPNVDFDKIKSGMHMFVQSEINDFVNKISLKYSGYEIEIIHKYEDVIFFKLVDHPEISVQHACRYSIGFPIQFYPYEIIIPKKIK